MAVYMKSEQKSKLNSIATVEISPLFLYGGIMDERFNNLVAYYRSVSISKKLVEQHILTHEESQYILRNLKQQYKIQEILDEESISEL